MMAGMRSLTSEEMKEVKGGYCDTIGGYFFCCPANKQDLQKTIDAYLKESQEKASKYIRFTYEFCNF